MVLLHRLDLPSAYVAGLQYEPLLESAGYRVVFRQTMPPLLPPGRTRLSHLAWRLGLRDAARGIERDWLDRHEDEIVRDAAKVDVVYAVKIPSLTLLRRIRSLDGPRILLGTGDALWLPVTRKWGWDDIEETFRISHAVTCVNRFTADHVRQYNPNVFIVPDCPQVEDFDARRSSVNRAEDEIRIGWIGSPETAGSLYRIWEPLEDLFTRQARLHLRLVGIGGEGLLNVPRFEKVRWSSRERYSREEMIQEVLEMHIGLFPQFRGDDALARGSLKAEVYMAGEAVAVAQDYGDNRELIDQGVNGFLAGNEEEWLRCLEWLVTHPDERATIARRGLDTVRERFSRERCFEMLAHALDSL